MVTLLITFLLFALENGIVPTKAAVGALMSPPPRSYTTLTARTSLINNHPCGNNAFSTQYPNIDPTYSNFLHQNILNHNSQYITEGGLLNVTWIPIFFSTNTSQYRFSLCMDINSYSYSKCIVLSEYETNNTIFDLHLSSYDINAYNSGYNYHWTSVTERFSMLDQHIKKHSLYVPDHLFHSLGKTRTSDDGFNMSATLIFEWIVSDYQTIDNCADIILLPKSDDDVDHGSLVSFSDLITTTLSTLPSGICTYNPNGTFYSSLDKAQVGDHCGPEKKTCPYGQCCNSDGVCGPYITNVYEYYYNNDLYYSIPIYTTLASFGFVDAITASMSFCETDVVIDNRYIPNSRVVDDVNEFIDLCWKCTLDDPKDCNYDTWFESNNTNAITNVYTFYDSSSHSSSNNNNDDSGDSGSNSGNGSGSSSTSNSNNSLVVDLVVILIFLMLFFCIFAWLYRTYKYDKTSRRTTKMRLLDLQSDDLTGNQDINNTGIDANGASMHSHDDITFGQHGYSDDSDGGGSGGSNGNVNDNNDDNARDPLEMTDESDNDKVGGILGRASLDASSANDTPLPPGWEEYRTDAGERYYHHPERDLTQWDRPE